VAPLLPGRRKGSKGSPSDSISLWLVRWVLFRFLLTCGLRTFIEKIVNILIYGVVFLAVVKLYSLKLNGTIIESNLGNFFKLDSYRN
jgi:hypothetical protein